MTEKTFLLCPGAAKSGTTWIRHYLGESPGTDMGRLGEMQVWDAITLPANARYRIAPSALLRLEYALARPLRLPIRGNMLRWEMQTHPDRYFDYFRKLLRRPGVHLTGDVSPGYAGLSAETFARLRDTFGRDGIRTRAVFTMRDPIERAWSALKMDRRKGRLPESQSDAEAFVARFGGEGPGDVPYADTLETLEAVFPENDLFATLYETLFTSETITAFSGFAGVPARPAAGGARVNAAGDRAALPEDLARRVFPHFESDYAAVTARFPEARQLWPHARLLG
ncbi:sulfotransferase family protein [Salipiger mucosus]|uniref:Sulfotransferase family protein n=1 Tax=Salipiger mucosus DSM 16094 TaxID=1123237 RepID=S9RQB7_9RHOB|nr:sulfotransferase family protein [Salipiger mucosus]EPX76194.1 hypothetical protein Salmuc_01978 [Salipiger mucosus DSM 16094]